MTILASLERAYHRLAERGEAPPFGYSLEKIGFLISLNEDGSLAGMPVDLRDGEGRKKTSRLMSVPQPAKRTSGIAPGFLWDKTAYVLGVTAGEGKRLSQEHAAFIEYHNTALAETQDPGLRALLRFLQQWEPAEFERLGWAEDMKDQNVVFALESERRSNIHIHDRPAAKAFWSRLSAARGKDEAICLVTGERQPIARLHPAIKGVWGAQSSGASIVSFNLDAFTSYGHDQGRNAPLSAQAAFAYTTALNCFLPKGSGHRLQIGDASTVFWADGSRAEAAESVFAAMFGDGDGGPKSGINENGVDEHSEAAKVGAVLDGVRKGVPLETLDPDLATGVRFHVLGLAPNASRLSVRFWFEGDFGTLARNYQRFVSDMTLDPPPRDENPPLWRYLREIAVLGKSDNVPPNLAGDWLRAILTGTQYPLTLMAAVLMRLRADRNVSALRVAILKALLVRNFKKEAPVALDPDNRNKGYLLGRLFASYEQVQTAALGRSINATIKDKFFGAASAQPRKVFALLASSSANHLSKAAKNAPGYKVKLEKAIGEIMDMMSPGDDPFPASLSSQDQALFSLGYYHQRNSFFKSPSRDTQTEGETNQ